MGAAATPLLIAGALYQGIQADAQARRQSRALRQQSTSERLLAAENEALFRRQQSRVLASRQAGLGAAGVDPSTGSPLAVSEDFAGEVELQAQRIRAGGDIRATRLEQQAKLTRSSGRSALIGGFLRSGSLLVSGSGKDFS
ncbi:MAG TPA: hypothetical protein ENH62_15775 [Marinobacter sp.]|uniref:Uncharacterized protein n=1 Tax=marine sediment metagenome TaxID=412755 RepID=A0A0F9Q510_9ZZZZ|nr:hypothetical protein [Marinobacter sp.]